MHNFNSTVTVTRLLLNFPVNAGEVKLKAVAACKQTKLIHSLAVSASVLVQLSVLGTSKTLSFSNSTNSSDIHACSLIMSTLLMNVSKNVPSAAGNAGMKTMKLSKGKTNKKLLL